MIKRPDLEPVMTREHAPKPLKFAMQMVVAVGTCYYYN